MDLPEQTLIFFVILSSNAAKGVEERTTTVYFSPSNWTSSLTADVAFTADEAGWEEERLEDRVGTEVVEGLVLTGEEAAVEDWGRDWADAFESVVET